MPQRLAEEANPAAGTDAASSATAKQPLHLDGTTFVLDSELSPDIEVSAQEIEAIARLLGDDLETILAKR